MKVLVCGACWRTIKQNEPFWQAFYSKQTFCCASCAAIAQGCTRYASGKEYDQIFHDRSLDIEVWDTIRRNTAIDNPKVEADRIRNESQDYRFDLDF